MTKTKITNIIGFSLIVGIIVFVAWPEKKKPPSPSIEFHKIMDSSIKYGSLLFCARECKLEDSIQHYTPIFVAYKDTMYAFLKKNRTYFDSLQTLNITKPKCNCK